MGSMHAALAVMDDYNIDGRIDILVAGKDCC